MKAKSLPLPDETNKKPGANIMSRKTISFIFYFIFTTITSLVVIDLISQQINSANGVVIPLIIGHSKHSDWHLEKRRFSVLDPHLGYAHSENEIEIKKLQSKYSWSDGFAVYSMKASGELDHPIILVLGGSTTDAVYSDHSWPEELSKLMIQRGVSGTVVNGGTSGYSSNQELLKLVRDGLEFKPDIIISYGGVNDRGDYGQLPYPMVHPYQIATLKSLISPEYSPLFPNTIYLLNQLLDRKRTTPMTITLGTRTNRTLAQQFERNLILMEAISRSTGATFYGIIQPNDYVGPGANSKAPKEGRKSLAYIAKVRDLYRQIRDMPARLSFVHSFISIFDGEDGTYSDDRIHATLKGDHIIAAKVLDLIYADISERKAERANP